MRTTRYLAIVLLAATASAYSGRGQQALARFQIVLDRSGPGWAAHCDTGCAWQDLSYACPAGCRVRIDANGVSTETTASRPAPAFAFVLERTDDGWQAQSVAGTAWTTVSWHSVGCQFGSCRARIDEHGVYGL